MPFPERLPTRADQALKTVFRYVSAVNQSRAKVVLDPAYELLANRMIDGVPLSKELRERQFEADLYPDYRKLSEKLRYNIDDWDFSDAKPQLLTPRQTELMETFATGESSFSTAAGFLERFKRSEELVGFFGIWYVEELNHHRGFHRYLERMGRGWNQDRRDEVQGVDFRPYAEDQDEIAAANMYQELAAYLVYRSFSSQCQDPFLARMTDRFAKDELRHYKFYESVLARRIQKDPPFRKIVLKHFLKATSPMNQVSGSAKTALGHIMRTAFFVRRAEYDFMLKRCEFLFGATLEPFFTFFYKGHLPPCEQCREEIFLCGCETFDPPPSRAEARA